MSGSIFSEVYKNINLNNNIKTNNSFYNDVGISVICSTNKKNMMQNILNNFITQNYPNKELIIILNYDNPSMKTWQKNIDLWPNIKIFNLNNSHSLGKCLNYAVSNSKYPIIAKFDDDDYYAPEYLSNMIKVFSFTDAYLIGKSCIYIYFVEEEILSVSNRSKENKYVNRVNGSTLMFKKTIFDSVKFRDKNLGEDISFCNDCTKNGFKIYSTDRFDYVYIRRSKNNHTWKMDNYYILNKSQFLCKTKDFKTTILWR
ncbi:glycosyltransferase [Wansuia hejianensis]|uniref:Glycosyltransferase n=1 Tax=Wansuia hejianensis TaxID=2763667 RepID=A0A926EXC2_9FIRM|nr:glycosyltransferase [Wansuia hejianensis]MBC8590681.1 glycosyltransferase [Wansuia hejianensis]